MQRSNRVPGTYRFIGRFGCQAGLVGVKRHKCVQFLIVRRDAVEQVFTSSLDERRQLRSAAES